MPLIKRKYPSQRCLVSRVFRLACFPVLFLLLTLPSGGQPAGADSPKLRYTIGTGYKYGWFAPEKFRFNSEKFPNYFLAEVTRKRCSIGFNYAYGYYRTVTPAKDFYLMKRGALIVRATSEYGLTFSYLIVSSKSRWKGLLSSGLAMVPVLDRRLLAASPNHFDAFFDVMKYNVYFVQAGSRITFNLNKHFVLFAGADVLVPFYTQPVAASPWAVDHPEMQTNLRLYPGISYTF